MRKYTVTLKFESHGPDDLYEAREDFNAMGLKIEDTFDLQNMGLDVQQHPRRTDYDNAVISDEGTSFFPEAQVVHPWDQGLWIFPEGHPLHVYERQAHRDYHSGAGTPEQREPIKVAFLEAGQKTLPPGGEQDET